MAQQKLTYESAVAEFGRSAAKKLSGDVARGEPEDQLRAPLEKLLSDLAVLCGRDDTVFVGEASLAELGTRPDYAVSSAGALVGFIEVKAPGTGADPRRFRRLHDKEQWGKLQALPNLIYTDGLGFSLWRNGILAREIVRLDGGFEPESVLKAPPALLSLLEDFLSWSPIPPRTPQQLAETSARLCRLLRAEVSEQLSRRDPTLMALADDWRHLLFPDASDDQFADSYAQAVTFGLLLARAQGISLDKGIDPAAKELATHQSLIGTAMRVLTDNVVKNQTLATSVATLSRVLAVVDWPAISEGTPDAWLYFYEDFLQVYDNNLRKLTGSYYTPVQVVKTMTRLVNEALCNRFDLSGGLASHKVKLIDPAMGTGTFLLEVVRAISETIADDLGEGAVPAGIAAALSRLIGFELQLGPYAVAQLRLLAELAEMDANASHLDPKLFVTNTLDNPFIEEQSLGTWYEPIAQSRREANKIKRDVPILVVVGNPPYKDKSGGKGGWIESGNPAVGQKPPLADFIPPKDWGLGVHVRHLYNPYVYFWRWATWKVFDHHADSDRGVVCLITAAGFLDGTGFERMRDYLRRRADAIWVIDCSPEGHQPPVNTRIFQGVMQPICITLALRDGSTGPDTPAPVYFRQLAVGSREDKFAELAVLSLADDPGWIECGPAWRAPFLPAGDTRWTSQPELEDLLRYSGTGTMSGRTWVVAPDTESLNRRWTTLIAASAEEKPALMQEHERDRNINKVLRDALPGFPVTKTPIKDESDPCPEPVRIGYRSFDRQWIIPDKRLINQPNPTLWGIRSNLQVYLTAPQDTTPTSGPAATLTGYVPDAHHYHGRGGRVYPLWLNQEGTVPNVVAGLLDLLEARYGRAVTAEDLFAYLAAVLANSSYTERFAEELTTPGLRVPLTADSHLFDRAAAIGRRIIWLHSYGGRFADPKDNRPNSHPRMETGRRPKVLAGAPIPAGAEHMPDEMRYDPYALELHIGTGRIGNVTPPMWAYSISGVNVLAKWFSYRRKTRDRPVIGDRRVSDLQDIQPDKWSAEYTQELIDLLNVLGLVRELEPAQAELLTAICEGSLITTGDLYDAGVLPVPPKDRAVPQTWRHEQSETITPLW